MNGTEKQVKWAEQIKTEYSNLKPSHEIDAEASAILDKVFNCKESSFWIFCKTQRKQGLRAIALTYHDRVAKLAKTGIDVQEILLANKIR